MPRDPAVDSDLHPHTVMVSSRGSQMPVQALVQPPPFIWVVWHGAAPAGRLWELLHLQFELGLALGRAAWSAVPPQLTGYQSAQVKPLHPLW